MISHTEGDGKRVSSHRSDVTGVFTAPLRAGIRCISILMHLSLSLSLSWRGWLSARFEFRRGAATRPGSGRREGHPRALRKLTLAFACSLCALAFVCALSGAPAGAAVIHKYLPEVSAKLSEGVPASSGAASTGPLSDANAMTVDVGEVFLAERLANSSSEYRLDSFSASSGAFVSQFSQAPSLSFLYQGVAVGHATGEGEVYVGGDESVEGAPRGVVAVFSAAGALQSIWKGTPGEQGPQSERFDCFECAGRGSVAVDNSGSLSWAAGDVYVADPERGAVDVFKPAAGGGEEYVTRLSPESTGVLSGIPLSVAVDSSDDEVLIVGGGVVDIFRPAAITGQYEFVRALTGTPAGSFEELSGVTVDGGNGDIYVTDDGASGMVDQFDASGEYLGRLTGTPAGPFSNVTSVAVDPASHDVYVGDSRGNEPANVDVFGASEVAPDVSTGKASNVQPGSLTLNGTVNPDAIQLSDCRFEYGTSTTYGQSAPCVPAAGAIPADSSVHAVSADVSGLAPGSVYHFRLLAANANGSNAGQDRLFGPPAIDGQSSANVAQTTATLQAQVDPEGVDTTCRFEYVDAAHYDASAANPYGGGSSVPCTPPDLSAGTSDVAASAELGGLRAGVTYHWRVVAVNGDATTSGSDQTLTTEPPARIDSVTITDVTAAGATLHAQIDPLGNDTTYRFEYGTDTGYTHGSVPVPDGDIGLGTVDVPVTQQLSGLLPNTTYHLRVVASNALGVERSADHTFVYDTSGGGLPDNRAYEMVTPPVKNAAVLGATPFTGGVPAVVAEDGSRVILDSVQCFAGAGSCIGARAGAGEPFAFTRTADGWVTNAMAPAATRFGDNSYLGSDADTGAVLFGIATPPVGEEDFYVRRLDGSFVNIGPGSWPGAGADSSASYGWVGTADFSHLVYNATADSFLWPFDATRHQSAGSLYEYVGAGNAQPALVGVSGGANSTDLISACGTVLGAGSSGQGVYAYGLSADGRVVYFTAEACDSGAGVNAGVPVPANALYARIDGSRTVAISARSSLDCTSVGCLSSPASEANFVGASADGSKAFFTDTQQLTDSASEDSTGGRDTASGLGNCREATGDANGCNLYEYDFDNPAGHNLLAISTGDTSGGGPRVQGVVAVSPDGSHVYFVAKGVLSAAANDLGQTAGAGANNLYVFERDSGNPGGHIAFVATLPDSDVQQWEEGLRLANVTPDGRFLVFTSHGALTRDDASTTGAAQVFRYDASRGELVRISIGNDGFNDDGNANAADASIVSAWVSNQARYAGPRSDPTMSHDGVFVFFQSPDGLTVGALNDVQIGSRVGGGPIYAENVYEYHEGHVYLLSDGRDTEQFAETDEFSPERSAVELVGSDATGANVFFTTADQLVGQDTDTEVDYYDARVCTASAPCVAAPARPEPPCQGEACHGAPNAAPVFGASGSETFTGAGNLTAPQAKRVIKAKSKARPKKNKHRKRLKAKRKKGRGAAASGKHVKRGRK